VTVRYVRHPAPDPNSATVHVPGPFDASTHYRFQVRALTGYSESTPCELSSDLTTPAWPALPTNLIANPASPGEIDLTWAASPTADSYTVTVTDWGYPYDATDPYWT
jgi:hypothetical protein